MVVDDKLAARAALALGLLLLAAGAGCWSQDVRKRRTLRRSRSFRTGRSTILRLARRAAIRRSPASAAASSTISTATPARAIRWNSARFPNSTPAKAKSRPAICARPHGKAPTPRTSNSRRRILSTKTLVGFGRRPCRARCRQDGGRSRQAGAKKSRSRRRRGVSDRAHGARDQCRARRQEHSRFSGL